MDEIFFVFSFMVVSSVMCFLPPKLTEFYLFSSTTMNERRQKNDSKNKMIFENQGLLEVIFYLPKEGAYFQYFTFYTKSSKHS